MFSNDIYIVSYDFRRARLVQEDVFVSVFPQFPTKDTELSYLDCIIVFWMNVAKDLINKESLAASMVSCLWS